MTFKAFRQPTPIRLGFPILFLLLLGIAPRLMAQQSEEFDQYKIRLQTYWFYSQPTGTVQGHADQVPVDFQSDLHFNTYSTFSGKVDWKFTHKNHLYIAVSPFFTDKQTTLNRTITFQGQTFDVGGTVKGQLHAFYVAPGYQYDIIRRRRGHLGLAAQINVFKTTAKISAVGEVSGGGSVVSATAASGSVLAPIPVAGPEFRLYLTNSPRLFVEGNVFGMYFFGYGSFVSSAGLIGVTLTKHISISGGYNLASHLTVNGASDRLGLQLSQKGALVGAEFSF
jgi:hypothetical protein